MLLLGGTKGLHAVLVMARVVIVICVVAVFVVIVVDVVSVGPTLSLLA